MDDAVGVDIESYLDLRYAARCDRNTDQIKLAEQLVVGCHLSFALEDANRNRRLIILRCGKYLAFLSRNGRVTLDQFGENTAEARLHN